MHMQPEDKVRPRHQLQILDHLRVPRVGIDLLRPPIRERMRRPRDQHQVGLLGQMDHVAPQVEQIQLRRLNTAADPCPHLDHRLVHLCLDPLLEPQLALRQHLRRDMRTKVPRLRIDSLVLLFDAQRKGWPHGLSNVQKRMSYKLFAIAWGCA